MTQDNRGKQTAGVDGIAKVMPPVRIHMVGLLCNLQRPASPIRRVYIPKRNSLEMRPLGIPTMLDRAVQALVKLTIEPRPTRHPEAKFSQTRMASVPDDAATIEYPLGEKQSITTSASNQSSSWMRI